MSMRGVLSLLCSRLDIPDQQSDFVENLLAAETPVLLGNQETLFGAGDSQIPLLIGPYTPS